MCRRDAGRHTLVQRFHDLIGGHDDDAAAIQTFSFTFPAIPQTGQGKHVAVTHADVVRHLTVVDDLPLVEAIRRNEAARCLKGVR